MSQAMHRVGRRDPAIIRLPAPRTPLDDDAPEGEVARRLDVPRTWSQTFADRSWHLAYGRTLLVVDLVAIVTGFGAAQQVHGPVPATSTVPVSQMELAALLVLAWWASLQLHGTRSPYVVGHGTEEYRRVLTASSRVLAVAAMLALAAGLEVPRGHLAVAVPFGLACLLTGRRIARIWLHHRRLHGHALRRVLVVGRRSSAAHIVDSWRRAPGAGYHVAGFWTPEGLDREDQVTDHAHRPEPASGAEVSVREALSTTHADAVLVTDAAHLGSGGMRELTWELDGSDVELFFSPDVLDVATTRLRLHDASGRPMLHVDTPRYRGANRIAKTVLDRIGAVVALVFFLPLLLVTAVAVKASSRGPVLYRQARVGRDGRTFEMFKFRSMCVDADAQLLTLLAGQGRSASELPKLDDDPRVCGVGRFIRRYSIDELPQLLNVLRGEMSLVGPRPQRHFEVALYDHVAHRRLALRPGMTGLWQVSGRSNLSFDEAIRLDVHYVENWSLFNDVVILWKTARAVLSSDGAC
jgi:exopolysaccharide biosynthesis polyprenyl glycosylphosphotransferase